MYNCENTLSVNRSGPEPTAPVRSSPQHGCPYWNTRHRSAQEASHPGRASQELWRFLKASVGFSRGGISKNKTWALTKTRGVLSWRWFTMWVSQQFRSPVWYEPRTSESSFAWPKLYRKAGKEHSLSGLRVGGVFCELRGMDLCLKHAILQKEIRFRV